MSGSNVCVCLCGRFGVTHVHDISVIIVLVHMHLGQSINGKVFGSFGEAEIAANAQPKLFAKLSTLIRFYLFIYLSFFGASFILSLTLLYKLPQTTKSEAEAEITPSIPSGLIDQFNLICRFGSFRLCLFNAFYLFDHHIGRQQQPISYYQWLAYKHGF